MSWVALGKPLAAFATIATVAIVAVADVFNATHLFNPEWPGHARFHIGMQFTTLVLVSLISLLALRAEASRNVHFISIMAPLSFWPGLLVAWLIPGTDVYASEGLRQTGIPINIILALIFITLSLLAFALLQKGSKTNFEG